MNIITVSREFGSGGRELGKRVADALGYAYYDREIITAVAARHDFNEHYVEWVLENAIPISVPISFGKTFSYSDATGQQALELLTSQCILLKEIAEKENCVIVGRSANIILEEFQPLNLFVYADMESKMRRCRERAAEGEVYTDYQLKRQIRQIDQGRARHQRFLSEKKWGDKAGYHLCVNTSGLEIRKIAPIVADFAAHCFEARVR